MVVVGAAQRVFDAVDAGQRRVERALEVVARLLQLQVDGGHAMGGVARFGWVAVAVEVARHRQAGIAPGAEPRAAERAGVGVDMAVGQAAAGNGVVAVAAVHAVGVQHETGAAGIDAKQLGLAA